MVRKSPNPIKAHSARRGRLRRRFTVVTVLVLSAMGLAGCGDPDDDDGGGGGYVSAHLVVQLPASGAL